MKKKIVKEEVMEEAPVEAGMPMITNSFNREDLNEMRDRVNELIAIENSK